MRSAKKRHAALYHAIEQLESRQLLSGTLASEGPVEVDLRASTVAAGTTTVINNLGNSAGTFKSSGGAITVGAVTDASSKTYQALEFSGTNAAVSSFPSPADLDGNNSRSIEVWVDNPTINNVEENMVSWAHRGGNPNGSNESFSYGSNYGVGQWGGTGYDLQWTNLAPGVMGPGAAPSANTWHYLVFTYDGTNNSVYVDGQLYLQQPVAASGLSTFAGFPISLAAENSATAAGAFTASNLGSLDLASVRIESGALTAADVANNYAYGVPGQSETAAPTTAPTLNALTGTDRFSLSWSYDPNASSYDVFRSYPASPTPVAIATGVEGLSYTDSAVTAGTDYTYYVESVDKIGAGPASNTESGTLSTLTTAPTLNPVTTGSGQVSLSWSSDPNALSYNVYRSDPGHPTPVAVATGLTALTYLDTSVTNGTTYTYYVTSVNNLGPGPASNTESGTPTAVPPVAPTGVVVDAENLGATGVQNIVVFPAVQFATSYIIQRATATSQFSGMPGAFATVPGGGAVTGTGPEISFADTDPAIVPGTNYFYRVYAVNTGGPGPASTPVEATATAPKAEGSVEVDVRASTLATGTTNTILNLGNSGGTFASSGGAITVGPVTDNNSITYQALQFSGTNAATSSFNAPADIDGNDPRSIEVWVDQPAIGGFVNGEETMVSWAHRGGPNGTNESFSYGTSYGVGQWGGTGYDLQWTNTAPGVTASGPPSYTTWHYLVFTYDGTNNSVYVDGSLYLQQPVAAGGLNTVGGLPVNLAAQNDAVASGFIADAGSQGQLDIASARIENGALTPADVMNNYVLGVPGQQVTAPVTTAPTLNPLTGTDRFNLSWSYDPNATSYTVYRSDPGHPTPVAIATGVEALSYTDTAVTAGINYTYYVTSVNSISGPGPASNTQSGTLTALTTAPTLNPVTVGPGEVSLTWSSDPNAVTYSVYRSDPSHPTPVAVATGITGLSYIDSSVTNGTTYTYYVTSVNNLGTGPASNTESGTPVAAPPAAPTGVTVTSINSGTTGLSNTVSFPSVLFATSYIIQRAPESAPGSGMPGTFATVPGGSDVTGAGSTITFVDSDPALQPDKNYFYKVFAVDSGGPSPASTPVEVATSSLLEEGAVEVDVRASTLATGTTDTITNLGNSGGTFSSSGGSITVGPVTDANSLTYQALQFNGTNAATSSFNSPADLNGNTPRSIEVWVDNPTIDSGEESMVSWAHRGGNPNGSNESFSYGSSYGVGQWGGNGYDLQWTNTAPGVTGTGAPAANTWHYLVFTYDGTNNDVYVDGQLYLQQAVAAGGLATFAGFPINLAAQNSSTIAGDFTASTLGSVDLASVRIETGALTAADVTNNFDIGVPGQFTVPAVTGVNPNTGPISGGTPVTITGTGFTGATTVTFGGKPATGVVVDSPTQITAIDPAATSAGMVNVLVTTATGGTSAQVTADQFTYVNATAPTVVSVTTNDGEGDGNTTQASEVRQLVVTFSEAVNLTQPGAFSLGVYNLNGAGGAVSGNGSNDGSITNISSVLNTATTTNGGVTWTITFAPSTANTDASASLIDGIYSFSINNSDVTSSGLALTGSNTYTFHRLYGDVTGTGAVNNTDARDFSKAYGAAAGSANYNAAFDFGGAGANINNTDARDFSLRYGQTFSSVLPAGGIN